MEQQSNLKKPNTTALRCIVKLGGAAITCKHEMEKINEESLATVSSHLRQSMMITSTKDPSLPIPIPTPTPTPTPGMDWSKRPGGGEVVVSDIDAFRDQQSLTLQSHNFIVVHGAGSFGHFQASSSGVHKGGLQLPLVKAGFVATRISVTSLNLEIVRALAREGIPTIGMPPFASGWSTCERNIAAADTSQVVNAIDSGFVPVLHGDAVFDQLQGCSILSGDVIIRHLAELLKPEYVVFLTDVLGVYDRPPSDSNPVLLREIAVDEDGNWSIVKPAIENMNKKVDFTVAAHDTTGGMLTKISEAAMIAKLGIDVYIVKAATSYSLRALKGEVRGDIPDDWLGTIIRSSR